MNKWLLSKKQRVVCTALALLESPRTKVLRPHPPGEMPVGTDRVKSAECPTNVKEVMARFVREAVGGLDALQEAVDCLEAYHQFQPEHVDRRTINAHLRAWPWQKGDTP